MIEIFKLEVKVGDKVKMILTTGKEPVGYLLEVGTNHILLKNEEGNSIRIFEILIGGWEKISQELQKKKEDKIIVTIDESQLKQDNISTNVLEPLPSDSSNSLNGEEDSSNKNNIIEDLNQNDETKEVDSSESKVGLKVIRKIPVDKLNKLKKRGSSDKTYRLRNLSKIYNVSITYIVSILKKEGIKVDDNPNSRINQIAFDLINKNLNQNEAIDMEKIFNKSIKDLGKKGLTLNSLDQLSQLKEKIEINISKQILPGNANIKRYFINREYGFLTDKEGVDYYFKYSEIKDDFLLKKLENIDAEGTQVICQFENFSGKSIAKNIFFPQTVEFFHNKAVEFFVKEKFIETKDLIELILSHFPDYSLAKQLKNKLRYNFKNQKRRIIPTTSNYISAKLEAKKGNLFLAKRHYQEVISNHEKESEYAIKELAYLLSGESKYDEAINLVKKHSEKIKFSDPNSFIAYFYEAKKDYENAIPFLKKLKPKSRVDKLKLSKRLAICFFGIGNYKEAEKHIRNVLRIQPRDSATNKLKRALNIAKAKGSEEEIESIFKEAEISAITGGLSKYIYYTLENCNFAGVPASEVAKENFSNKTLALLKKYIKEIKDGRPRERAEAYLSQAKIEQILDSENTFAINSALAKYCVSSAISWANENKQVDTLRYLITEAAILENDYHVLRRYIPLYLHSFSLSSFKSKSKIRQNWSELIEQVVLRNDSILFWFGVLELLLVNSKFSTQFLTSVYNKEEFKKVSLEFLRGYLEEDVENNIDKKRFLQLWKNGREKLKREKDTLEAKFLSLTKANSTEAITESFIRIDKILPSWLGQLDNQRIDALKDIIDTVMDFNKQQAFEDKERYHNISINQLTQLNESIIDAPTEISFNVLIPVIKFIKNLLEYEFKNVVETSKPKLKVQIYGEGSCDERTGLVEVQFSVSNKKGSAPISYLELEVNDSNGIEFIKENNIINQSLKGDEERVLKLKLIIDNEIIEEGATIIKLTCNYRIRGNIELLNQNEELTLRFYSSADFNKIENPFSSTADSGPVEDVSMFFGRNQFIQNIKESIINSNSKCVIIYGQKRSGKSSVLHHLRKSLNNSEIAFCVSFSLGEIIEDLSSKSFYYTILTEIEDSLALISEKHEYIPEYIAPEYSQLEEAPAIMFNNQIKILKREFKKYPNWKNKKLVLLIDEFTYIYTAIQKEFLSEQFMKTWKSFLEKGFFTSVLIGQDIMPKFKSAYPNEFGVTEDKRLSYLKKNDAIKLIEEPIWDKTKDRSRFLGKATDLILDYTSSNPYYVQIFCARLVDYMNDKKAISVTEADVQEVALSFIKGEQALTADKFDNLITAGDSDLEAFDVNDVLSALKTIAIASKNLNSCSRDAINLGERDYEEKILKDLKDREVLSSPQPGYFKINVRLFKEWLLIN